MLILKRRAGQWIEVIHAASGDTAWIQIAEFHEDDRGMTAKIALDDPARNFEFQRPDSPRDKQGPRRP